MVSVSAYATTSGVTVYPRVLITKDSTNAGAIATVACSAQTDTAISGGVQYLSDSTPRPTRATRRSLSSFPGRLYGLVDQHAQG